ncbi:MAG: hypothetical protein HQK92_13435 [Nitrospirae bacterium]|nr:hypothetical protein [Nitrospirota bacterium]
MATAIDTLKIYERLKSADLSDKAAKEIAEIVRESSDFSTTTKVEIKEELSKELASKSDLQATKAELKEDISKLDTKMSDTKAELLKWMFIFWASQIGILVALIKFLK